MRLFSKLTFAALAALVLGSCQKHSDITSDPGNAVQPVLPAPLTANLQGNVFDETGAPAPGVTVKVGAQTATTDSRGYFRLNAAALDKNQALVTATKAGYFKAYRSFAATTGTNQVVLKLVKRALAATLSATTGGDAPLANGSKVALPAGAVVDAATGAAYTGSVKVYAAYIDPSAQDISLTVPGSFLADDHDGRRSLLTSYGMLAVELEGSAGQKLQIRSGQSATLTTAIPAAAQASAPATIPMWYLDEATGVWKEEGTATKTGNAYVGNVPHFSFWNCDVPLSAVTLSVTVHAANNQPLSHVLVRITRSGGSLPWNGTAYGYTDSLGQVSGLVPANEALVLEVLDNCWTPVYTQNIAALTTNTSLPTITANINGASLSLVSGTLLDCNNAPVTNGYAVVVFNNQVQYAAVNGLGQFAVNMLSCSGSGGSVSVLGINNATGMQSAASTVPFAATTTAAGTISVCTQSAATFINYTIDGGTQITLGANDSLSFYSAQVQGTTNWRTTISGMAGTATGSHVISLDFTGAAAAGTYPLTNIYVEAQQTSAVNINTNVTAWPATLGNFIEGTFTGTYVSGGTTHAILGAYRLRRMF